MNYTSTSYNLSKRAKLVVRTVVDRTEGKLHNPDAAMITAVISKWREMCKALASNTDIDEDMEWPEPDVINCDDYRVQIFGDVEIKLSTGEYYASVPMFNEYTDPRETVGLMREMMRGLWVANALPDRSDGNGNSSAPPLANTPQEFADHAAANGGKVDLAQQFQRPGEDNAAPASHNSTDTITYNDTVIPLIETYDYNREADYVAAYTGRLVAVNICRIANVYRISNSKGTPYQVVEFYPFYDNDGRAWPSKHPAYSLNKFVPEKGHKSRNYRDWKAIAEYTPEENMVVEGNFHCVYKLNENNGKVYWNLQAIIPTTEFSRTTANGEDIEEPSLDMEAASDIPF